MEKVINKIINKTFNTNIVAIQEIISKGIVNRVFIVNVTSNKKYIVRLRDNIKAITEYEKETWCIKQASNLGILSPIVYAVDIIDNYAYMVESFIDGINGAELISKHNDLWEKNGELAKIINSIKVYGFGMDFKGEKFYNNFTPDWESFIYYNVTSLNENDMLINFGVYDIFLQPVITKAFIGLLNEHFNFGLCHGDLSPRNVVVKGNEIYLIDWGSALINIYPHYDIITLLKAQIMASIQKNNENSRGGIPSAEQFFLYLKGYGISNADYQKMEKNIYALLLLDAFDKLRWAIDKSQNDIEEFSSYAKIVLVKYIEKLT